MTDQEYIIRENVKNLIFVVRLLSKLSVITHPYTGENLTRPIALVSMDIDIEFEKLSKTDIVYKYILKHSQYL